MRTKRPMASGRPPTTPEPRLRESWPPEADALRLEIGRRIPRVAPTLTEEVLLALLGNPAGTLIGRQPVETHDVLKSLVDSNMHTGIVASAVTAALNLPRRAS